MLAVSEWFSDLMSNPVDQVFFGAIGLVIVIIILLLVASKIVSAKKSKRVNELVPETESKETTKEEGSVQESSADEATTIVVEETETLEEEPVQEEVESKETTTEESVEVETLEETPVENTVVEESKEESEATEDDALFDAYIASTQKEEEKVEEETTLESTEQPVEETTEEPVVAEKAPAKKKTTTTTKAKTATKKSATPEDTEKKGRQYNGKIEVYQDSDGYRYQLKASNGEVLVVSESYTARDGVMKAIDAVKRNLETGEVRVFADKRGKFKFKLVSRNYRVLALSANYSTEKGAIRAAESFKKFALKADIVDVELEDLDAKTATIIEVSRNEDKQGGKFFVEKFNGEYSWDLKASNGQILCQAEGYTSKAGCLYSIETFKKNVENGIFKCVKDKNERYWYKLYSINGRICAVGESYPSKQSAESAAGSVCAYYKNAEIVELKEQKTEK